MKQTVYTASPESQQIHVWSLNHEGTLTLVQVVDVPGQVQPMVQTPERHIRALFTALWPIALQQIQQLLMNFRTIIKQAIVTLP
ncbi:hypothetical protein MJL30_35010, partial [Salmonella enterica subsp. enterica serovar Anatum]|nr:hypothetical protein [Salmonella enterica subsp. enterica serovar Anatum]